MYNVTLVDLAPDARSSIEGGGPVDLGRIPAAELAALLEVFAELDPLQNVKADPEIRVQSRRDRFIIRTGQKKLFLYDARQPSEPAHVLSAAEIIAELDGSAAARRTTPPIPLSPFTGGEPAAAGSSGAEEITPLPEAASRPWPFALIGLAVLLSGYVVYSEWVGTDADSNPTLSPLSTSERLAEDSALTAVYMTGSDPGHYGIVILGDGKLKLFRVNAQAAPGVVYGTYRLGRLEAKLCLATDQPGGLIKVIDRDTLEYGGETYKRIP